MAKNRIFQIPSVDEIANYEKEQPKVQSHFKAHKGSTSSNVGTNDKVPLIVSNSNGSGGSDKPVMTASQFIPRNNGHSSNDGTSSGFTARSSDLSKRKNDHLPNPAGESRKRLAGSSFAAKFGSLPSVEGEDDHSTKPQSSRTDPETSKPVTSNKPVASASNPKNTTNSILVNPRQRGNPILKSVRNIPWEFADIVPDYVMGRTTCALFLSLRYHHLNPNYIHSRLKELGYSYELRILLVQVDVKDPHYSLKELARMAILAECTLILAWSPEEAGRYLETYKSYENKPVDALKERIEQDFVAQVTDCLTTVKSVNRTDVVTLLSTFGTVANIISAEKEELNLLPGFGPQKAQRLHDIFQEPFNKQP